MRRSDIILCFLVVSCVVGSCHGDLRKNFYKKTCPSAEEIIKNATWDHVTKNPNLPAKLLRMHFHDCFVRGCDGSVLLNSTSNSSAEKDAIPNLSLQGFDVIDDLKSKVEKKCPGVVSCADILSLAARDSVSFQFKKPMWEVLTGRRDGRVSLINDALRNLPPPTFNFTQLNQSFASKGLNVHDLVVLSGGHTLGIGHCGAFNTRLYNFSGKGDQDPSLDPTYATFLKTQCKNISDTTPSVEMDPHSSKKFDSNYYKILREHKGLFTSDAALLTNKGANKTISELIDQDDFFTEFAQSMKRMGNIQVLTGTDGEIRNKCALIN